MPSETQQRSHRNQWKQKKRIKARSRHLQLSHATERKQFLTLINNRCVSKEETPIKINWFVSRPALLCPRD